MITETRRANIKLFVLIAAFVVGGTFLGKIYLDAKSPSSVKVTVYKMELMTGRLDAHPLVVFSDAAGKEIDLANETGEFIGQAPVTVGVYTRIRLTVKNGIKMSIADAKSNPCGGGVFTDRVFPIAEGTDLNSQVPVYFATDLDGGGAWVGSQITNLMIRPLTVSENRTTPLKFVFVIADTLFCPDGEVQRRAPWSVWPETSL